MLQKVLCAYTASISKFKANPSAALAEAGGDAVAVSLTNETPILMREIDTQNLKTLDKTNIIPIIRSIFRPYIVIRR